MDLLLVETSFDTLKAKAALFGSEGVQRASLAVPVPARGATCPPRCTVQYWNAAATISYLRDALLVQLPIA